MCFPHVSGSHLAGLLFFVYDSPHPRVFGAPGGPVCTVCFFANFPFRPCDIPPCTSLLFFNPSLGGLSGRRYPCVGMIRASLCCSRFSHNPLGGKTAGSFFPQRSPGAALFISLVDRARGKRSVGAPYISSRVRTCGAPRVSPRMVLIPQVSPAVPPPEIVGNPRGFPPPFAKKSFFGRAPGLPKWKFPAPPQCQSNPPASVF